MPFVVVDGVIVKWVASAAEAASHADLWRSANYPAWVEDRSPLTGNMMKVEEPKEHNMNKIPSIYEVQRKGEHIDSYSVVEGLDASNAGEATLYNYKGKLWEVVVWNDRALNHKSGEVTMDEVDRESDEAV